ncbi:MAG: DUF4239 domain-containing protein [Rubrobacter sp.]|nr:DUF4239 domain-containing protein [Rubrobacter sp.]MBA3950293.1 DUF4239 domain-containing protein [Rubrobacter sp.]MDQ3360081.1 DUF4239 domain-containing protein [Actinomycetota bacterium]MDQ3378334.1 DUF4239 domain-containing protein [Actinomycetota bacterium]
METVLWGVLVVGLSVALAVAGFAVVRRFVPLGLRELHSSNTAVMFAALYVIYGLIVGFSAYFASYQYDTAQKTVEAEAGSVEELHRLAEGFPEVERQEVQNLSESYARTVVEEGWPMMREGWISARAGTISDELRRGVLAFEPRTEGEGALYSQALTLVGELDQNRALRLLEVREGIPSILWVVLILGGAATVCFTYLLGVGAEWLHVSMIVAYTAVLALILYTVWALDYPFDGLVQVGPDAFEAALSRMESYRGR